MVGGIWRDADTAVVVFLFLLSAVYAIVFFVLKVNDDPIGRETRNQMRRIGHLALNARKRSPWSRTAPPEGESNPHGKALTIAVGVALGIFGIVMTINSGNIMWFGLLIFWHTLVND